MSAALALEIETASPEHVIADALVTAFFSCERPLRGPAARADWRLCGLLSQCLQREDLTGALGEAVLIPTGGRMRCPILLAMGLGPRSEFGEQGLRQLAWSATTRVLGLRLGSVGIALPGEVAPRLGTSQAAGIVLEGVAGALSKRPSALRLRLVVKPEDAGRTRSGLLETASRLSSTQLAIRLEQSPRVPPHPVANSTPRSGSPAGKIPPRAESRR